MLMAPFKSALYSPRSTANKPSLLFPFAFTTANMTSFCLCTFRLSLPQVFPSTMLYMLSFASNDRTAYRQLSCYIRLPFALSPAPMPVKSPRTITAFSRCSFIHDVMANLMQNSVNLTMLRILDFSNSRLTLSFRLIVCVAKRNAYEAHEPSSRRNADAKLLPLESNTVVAMVLSPKSTARIFLKAKFASTSLFMTTLR